MVNYKEANKLCKTGTCFLLGTFILGSYSMVEVAWLRRFSTILGVGELFLGIELGQRVHPEAPFGLFSNPISGKICELKLFSPYKTGIIRFGWNRIRDALTTTILIVFCGAPLQLLGHELPNDSGTSCVGDAFLESEESSRVYFKLYMRKPPGLCQLPPKNILLSFVIFAMVI